MTIALLRITNFRNLEAVDLVPCHAGLNVICGNNGSGKTSLLEAIYCLGLGRSFRTSTGARLIRQEADKFSIFSHIVSEMQRQVPVGIERDIHGTTRLRVAERDASGIMELAAYLPIRLINSQSHNLFESGPAFRRKFLDWGLFYQSDSFITCWRQFERVIKQRNVLLRDRRPRSELDAWSDELARHAMVLDELRRRYVNHLMPLVSELAQELLAMSTLAFAYQPGWREDRDYLEILKEGYLEEIRAGHTLHGPHRADLDITIDGIPVKHFLSRGQQKLLICAMIIAQGKLLAEQANKSIIYLVDDLPAELDLPSRQKLITLLSRQHTQIFVTAIERETIETIMGDRLAVPIKVFHVKHGSVTDLTMSQS
ncbi:DNA replication and repair protein RecF [Aquicella siphonis]|uniref:DNA replication and repair protein RecF n=1 Tax=Aquicella siphonis TaxID=254247 RepID=A0A5E4PKW5_9COXI|nr:DNA replication/repair protein RecF [Aquicella siphonis]VVC76892.1 DNA replication and repair protein RecF [Aquicella siphonis]